MPLPSSGGAFPGERWGDPTVRSLAPGRGDTEGTGNRMSARNSRWLALVVLAGMAGAASGQETPAPPASGGASPPAAPAPAVVGTAGTPGTPAPAAAGMPPAPPAAGQPAPAPAVSAEDTPEALI